MKFTKITNNQWVAISIVALVIVAAIAMKVGREQNGEGGMPSPSASARPRTGGSTTNDELTSQAGTYRCADGKSFTLTVLADGTARVTGATSSGVILTQSQIGIWASDDLSVSVREVADYTVLIENDVVTRDFCHLR